MLKRLLRFVFSIIVAVCLFLLLIMFVPIKTKTPEKVELTYIFIDDDGMEYNVFDKSHGAAKDWSFLFRPKTGDNETLSTGEVISETGLITSGNDMLLTGDYENESTGEDNILQGITPEENTDEQNTGSQNLEENLLTGDYENESTGEDNILQGITSEENTDELNTGSQNIEENLLTGMELAENTNAEPYMGLSGNTNKGDKGNVLGNKDYIGDTQNTTSGNNIVLSGSSASGQNLKQTGTVTLIGDKELPLENTGFDLPDGAIEKPLSEDCETPWGITIKNNESVLAYQQRSDVPDICNVQRRTCKNGKLDGSFMQPSCDESVSYIYTNKNNNLQRESSNVVVYTKKEVVSKNPKDPDSLIQNPKYAKNDAAEFDKNGKIKSSGDPITERDANGDEWEYADNDSVEQINFDYYNCKSPWGELIQHGQFVKAYEFPYGFTNSNCKTELRLCVDGSLKGSYKYKDCEYIEMTYEEYNNIGEVVEGLAGGEHQITNKEKKGFWNRLKNLFK